MFHVKPAPEAALAVSRETEETLRAFVDLLLQWNRRLNLISARSAEDVWRRHVLDALQLVPLMPPGTTGFVDLGSGAGFPGLVLAIAADCEAHLIEADKRKAAFLTHAAARLGISKVAIHAVRIEDAGYPERHW